MKVQRCLFLLGLLVFWQGRVGRCADAPTPEVYIIADSFPGSPAGHGLEQLKDALRRKGISCQQVNSVELAKARSCFVMGAVSRGGEAARFVREQNLTMPSVSESFLVKRCPDQQGKSVWLVAGSDERALMYGELELAEYVGWSSDSSNPFSEVQDTVQRPDATTRAISI